jgi:hypothetical protein
MRRRIIKHVLVNVLFATSLAFAGDEGIVAKYTFDGNANDVSVNGHHGIVSNAVLTEDRFGNPNSAYHFNGVDSYIEVPNNGGAFDLTSAWTISVWVKSDPSRATNVDCRQNPIVWKIAQEGGNLDNFGLGYGFGYDTTWGYPNRQDYQPRFVTITEGVYPEWDYVARSGLHAPGHWYHLISEYDGQYLKITVDGVEEGRQIYNSPYGPIPINSGPAPLRIGSLKIPFSDHGGYKCSNCAGTWFGVIDDIVIYNRALTPEEKQELFTASNPNQKKVVEVDCDSVMDTKVSNLGLDYTPIGFVRAYPNLIWPPNNKDKVITFEGRIDDSLALVRFGAVNLKPYLLVGGNRYDLSASSFAVTIPVKAIKGVVYPVELHVIDSTGRDTLVDKTSILVETNMSGK